MHNRRLLLHLQRCGELAPPCMQGATPLLSVISPGRPDLYTSGGAHLHSYSLSAHVPQFLGCGPQVLPCFMRAHRLARRWESRRRQRCCRWEGPPTSAVRRGLKNPAAAPPALPLSAAHSWPPASPPCVAQSVSVHACNMEDDWQADSFQAYEGCYLPGPHPDYTAEFHALSYGQAITLQGTPPTHNGIFGLIHSGMQRHASARQTRGRSLPPRAG